MTVENDIKDEEMKAIEELRKRFVKEDMEPEIFEDNYSLRRFLIGRDFNIDNAEIMLRKTLEWRKKYNVKDMINYKKSEVAQKYFPYMPIGFDKEGDVLRYCNFGNMDFNGLLSSVTIEETIKVVIHEIERDVEALKKQSIKFGQNIDKIVFIMDFGNLSFSQVTDKRVITVVMNTLQLFINNYPERLKGGYALNVSVYFSFVYSLMKAILPATVMKKVHVYSDDSYKEHFRKIIDADELPAFLGGNKTDPDGNPLCKTFIDHGGEKVPEHYYIRKTKQPLSKLAGVKKVTLSRAAFHEVKLQVKEPGSFLEWEFETKCRDIGFGLFYEEVVDGEEKITELISIQRIDTEAYPETGTYRCDHAGTYVILFDNTYSWVRAKEIYYRAKIVTPKEQQDELDGS